MSLGIVMLAAILSLAQAAGAPAGRLAGQVIDQDRSTPIVGARVIVLSMSRPIPGPPSMLEGLTDSEGRFAFDNLQPGAYRIEATKAGYATETFNPTPIIVEVLSGQAREGVSVTLRRGGVVTGHVLDASGEPLAEVSVMAMRRPPVAFGGQMGLIPGGPVAQTNDLGEYRLYGLAPGDYYIQVGPRPSGPYNISASRATMTVPTFYPGTAAADSAQMISVVAGQTVSGIDVRLIVAPAFQVSGVVVDESGAPVDGAMLTLMVDRSPAMMFGPPISTRSNPDGTFTIVNLTAGNYTLRAAVPMQAGAGRGQVFASGGVGAVSSGVFVAGGGSGVTTWSVDSRNGTVAQYASDDSTQSRVTVVDANVEGVKVTVRRP